MQSVALLSEGGGHFNVPGKIAIWGACRSRLGLELGWFLGYTIRTSGPLQNR